MIVVSPWSFKLWLEEYSDVQDFGINKIIFINNEEVLFNNEDEASSNQRYEVLPLCALCVCATNITAGFLA